MTRLILGNKIFAAWMVAGVAAFAITSVTVVIDNHKTVAAEVKRTVLGTFRVASADDRGNSVNGAESSQRAVSFSAEEAKLMIGDRLKVSVYEKLGSGTEGSSTSALSSLVEHTEMSGEYTVQTDGGIFLPFIGRMDAAGKTSNALQQALEHKIAIFKGQAVSTVRLLEREPVYVTGSVSQPGTFKYTPGMMVLNALILAGTMPAGQTNGQNLELVRMTEHLQQADVKLANLLAERDVLISMRDGKSPKASRALVNLFGNSHVADLIAAATKLAELKDNKYSHELQALAADRQMLENQRVILTNGMGDALAALNHAKERMNAVLKLRRTGITTDNTYYQAVGDLDLSQARLNDLKTALAKLEAQIIDVNEREKKVIVDMKVAREQAIADLQVSIAEVAVTRDTLRPALASTQTSAGDEPRYAILRRNSGGLEKINADRFSALQPGDIVEVVRTVRPFLDANADANK